MRLRIGVEKVPDVRAIQRSMLRSIAVEFDAMAYEGIVFLNAKIADWDNKTTFKKEVEIKPGKWQLSIRHTAMGKEAWIFKWVDEGTGTHGPRGTSYVIAPVRADFLRFNVPHMPKTRAPGGVRRMGAQKVVYAKMVTHPGIEPRKFSDELKATYRKTIVPRTHKAARRGLQRR
jgi:hypothetical protein